MEVLQLEEIKKLTDTEINNKVSEVKAALFDLAFKKATKKNIKTHYFKLYKRMLSQLLTIKTQLKQ